LEKRYVQEVFCLAYDFFLRLGRIQERQTENLLVEATGSLFHGFNTYFSASFWQSQGKIFSQPIKIRSVLVDFEYDKTFLKSMVSDFFHFMLSVFNVGENQF
jgi:hypothetical protein